MKVFLRPTGFYSMAMVRVANALARWAPDCVKVIEDKREADIVLSHIISAEQERPECEEIIAQYCLYTASPYDWSPRWRAARMVWSYYDLAPTAGVNYYHSPLGIDHAFKAPWIEAAAARRDIAIITSGYVSGPGAEAIEEPAIAADSLGLRVVHVGPPAVEGLRVVPPRWSSVHGVSDYALAALYRRAEWVSGLRHVEGFEMPCIEGLACGARPVVFDRPDMTKWYEGHAVFIPESHGEELVETLKELFRYHPAQVTEAERKQVLEAFNWETIAKGFWERAL